jgi:mono/diheme cytochrome c family protein
MTRLFSGVLLALVSAAGSTTVWPQEAPMPPDQLARGRQVFMLVCAACHGEDGQGLPEGGPAIIAAPSLAYYATAADLFDTIRRTMPEDNPGSLSEQEYWDVVAHILAQSGLNPEGLPVGPETAGSIPVSQQ